jgi:para-nitrobenzyl esterase
MRTFLTAALISIAAPLALIAVPAAADAPAVPAAGGYEVASTDLGTLLEDPGAKAVLVKYIPALVGNDQIQMARAMTLKQLQQYAGDMLTDETLGKIQMDLDKLPKH